jgi:hypothetical protein
MGYAAAHLARADDAYLLDCLRHDTQPVWLIKLYA